MLQFIYSQIIFYAAIALVMFVPGYFLLSAIFRKSRIISSLEKFILSFGLSIVSVDFIFFAFDKMEFPITRFSILSGIAVFSAVSFLVYKMGKTGSETDETGKLFDFSKKQFGLIILLIFLMFFIKTAYLSGTVFPTSTDMGHHMYWAKWMVENNQLPTYDGMPDFIIGEHTVFGALAILGSLDFFSAFPPAMLFLINILGILTVFILTLRIFKNKTIAILSLLFLGVLFAVSSPQAKFISGGVVGNIFGNFLMPLALYLYFRAFEFINLPEKGISAASQKRFLALAIFVTFGLFYTHHLTSFIFLFVFAFLAGLFLLLNFTDIKVIIPRIFRLVFSPQVMSVLLIGIVFMFFVFTPTYFENNAVNTAVGAPSKSTREGLSLSALKSSIGEARLAFGFLGLLLLAFAYKRRNFGYAVVSAWAAMIFIMSSVPQVLFINLPSNRIGNYLSYPFAILSAYALYSVFRKDSQGNFSEKTLIRSAFILVFVFVLAGGILESAP
ncbi:MAG TPA: hypothetical protein DIT25_03340 [Candidatus Moranbacteria bacterium]|nr:hypothetical protein [Candidatus Moranbacteria bacterium]